MDVDRARVDTRTLALGNTFAVNSRCTIGGNRWLSPSSDFVHLTLNHSQPRHILLFLVISVVSVFFICFPSENVSRMEYRLPSPQLSFSNNDTTPTANVSASRIKPMHEICAKYDYLVICGDAAPLPILSPPPRSRALDLHPANITTNKSRVDQSVKKKKKSSQSARVTGAPLRQH